MYLGGQGGQRGYAMAALLVALGVMAVLMTAAMPVWRHESQREKEIETIFRGQQIARAIAMYREKNGGNFPSSLDLLVQQRFLRKKYKDPFSEDGEWQPIGGLGGQPAGGRGGQRQTAWRPRRPTATGPAAARPGGRHHGRNSQGQGHRHRRIQARNPPQRVAVPVLRHAIARRRVAGRPERRPCRCARTARSRQQARRSRYRGARRRPRTGRRSRPGRAGGRGLGPGPFGGGPGRRGGGN